MNSIIDEIRKELLIIGDAKTKQSGEKFFREEVRMYGVKASKVHSISKDTFKKLPDKSKSAVFDLCEELLKSGLMEESFIACNWSYYVHKQYVIDDFEVFGNWVKMFVNNWATCDTLCNHSVGSLVEKYPECITGLKEWAKSENRWMRRASAVSLIIPARNGKFLNEILEIADILLTDKDDMVQKGYGWMLKESGKANQKVVFGYVMKNKMKMPRTALRYAIEKLPADLKEMAMAK